MSGIAFQNVAGLKPGKTRFDWHTSKKFDCEFGQLIPIFLKFCIPGDYWKINNESLVRCTPLINPTMHEVTIDTHYFYIPYRILDDCNSRPGTGNPLGDPMLLGTNPIPGGRFNWELYITGGFKGTDNQTVPKWKPSGKTFSRPSLQIPAPYKYSLWDYMDLPVLNDGEQWSSSLMPLDFLRRAYNLVYNEYYRDETLQEPVLWTNEYILLRNWQKDYFTSALPFQQRGDPVGIDINLTGNTFADFTNAFDVSSTQPGTLIGLQTAGTNRGLGFMTGTNTTPGSTQIFSEDGGALINTLNNNQVKMGMVATSGFDIADIRLAFQLQKWMERNARAGVRYNEYIESHWDEDIKDFRLWRPEYIGGTKVPLIISEVLQTSQSQDTPQGNMAGHGISISGNYVGDHHCDDYGIIIGLQSIMPKPAYEQGIDRTWLYDGREEFPQAEFVNLSEQAIMQGEIYINNDTTDSALFGYQGMYDELRTANSHVCGSFRDTLADWHLTRIFSSPPLLNEIFIQCDPTPLRRIFAVQSDPGLLCDVQHTYYAVRRIPEIAEPGLLDHH